MRVKQIMEQRAIVFGSGLHQESFLRLCDVDGGQIVWYEYSDRGWDSCDDDDFVAQLEAEYQEVLNAD